MVGRVSTFISAVPSNVASRIAYRSSSNLDPLFGGVHFWPQDLFPSRLGWLFWGGIGLVPCVIWGRSRCREIQYCGASLCVYLELAWCIFSPSVFLPIFPQWHLASHASPVKAAFTLASDRRSFILYVYAWQRATILATATVWHPTCELRFS